jgi:predicted CXXCH cytochrome family protein
MGEGRSMFLDTDIQERVSHQRKPSWNRPSFFCTLLVLVVFLLALTGCNRHARYQVLNTFFDGVPHPDEVSVAKEAGDIEMSEEEQIRLRRMRPIKIRYRHPSAGAEGECAFCHGDTKALVIPGKDMCVKCHTQVKEKKAFIHGPAVLDCIVCHDPHESKVKALLKVMGNELCFACHYRKNREDAYKAEAHKEVEGEEFLCLACHDPHGGNDRFFVKDAARMPKKIVEEETIQSEPSPEGDMPIEEIEQETTDTDNLQ